MKKSLIFVAVLVVAIICALTANFMHVQQINNVQGSTEVSQSVGEAIERHASLTAQTARAGEIGKISQTVVIDKKTGTAPFDADNNPGNDSSESNNIVRSFDQIIWTLELTMDLKDPTSEESGLGGIIQIKASLPENCKNHVMWDTKSMAWAEDIQVTEDGTVFEANYSLNSDSITVPGKKTLVVVLKALDAPNGLQFKPSFETKLYGNEDSEVSRATADTITVSAAPKYNIQLNRNPNYSRKRTVDLGSGDVEGRMYGYSFALQIHNGEGEIDKSKGLKGLEFPKGEITFDVDLALSRADLGAGPGAAEDITSQCTPILWNYSYNYGTTGIIEDRTMNFGSYSQYDVSYSPWGVRTGDRNNSTYDSGTLSITQTGSKLKVKVNDYKIDGIFPHYHAHYAGVERSSPMWGEHIGAFSIGYMQIFVPDNSASTQANKDYYFTVSDSNFKATSVSGVNVTSQIVTTDDSDTRNHVLYSPGSYSQPLYFDYPSINSIYYAGDGRVTLGQNFNLYARFDISPNSDDDILSATRFIKFDGDAFEPRLYNETTGAKYYGNWGGDDPMEFNVWYVTKQNGQNWTSIDEQRDAQIEDMRLYENITDIPSNYKCVGMYFESTQGRFEPGYPTLYVPLRTKTTAQIGTTYGFYQRTKMWKEAVDRTQYTITRNSPSTWPTPTYDPGDLAYVKTEYDESGSIVVGTHGGGWVYGQSLLVIGSNLQVSKKAIDPETNTVKVNYDLGKGENIVTFKVEPVLPTNVAFVTIDGLTIKVEDTLPAGINYIPGSCNYQEPTITNNPDGTTTLVWYKYDCATGRTIDPILYRASIPVETDNGAQFETKVLVSEVIEAGAQTRIGITDPVHRTARTSISIINMETYGLFKNTDNPVIERNGNIKYNLLVTNTSEVDAPEFQLLDILPYNGDRLGTNYHGTYTVNRIVMKQYQNTSGDFVEVPLTITAYYSNNNNVRSLNAKNVFNNTSIWTGVSSGQAINQALTGLAFRGNLSKRSKVEIEVYLNTNNNEPKDIYKNAANLQTRSATAAVSSQIAVTRVVSRSLTGTVWNDRDEDGIMADTEERIQGATVTLVNDDGTTAHDIYGNAIPSITTDENGYYKFENMIKGKYKVRVAVDYMQQMTVKEAGADERVNSKFNPDYQTDTLTRLNGTNEPVVEQDYINAGVIYMDSAGVIVHHYEVDSTVKIKLQDGVTDAPDVEYSGKVTDPYETTDERNRAEYYRLIGIPDNWKGRMKLEQTVVIYYYMPQGWIEVTKKDDFTGEVLEGVKFEVYSDSELTNKVADLTTGADGKAKTELLDRGTYYVKEIEVPDRYNLNDTVRIANIERAGQTVEIEHRNIPYRGYIEAVKKDNQTGEIITKESTIYALYEWSVADNDWVKPTHIVEGQFDGLVSDGKGYRLKEEVDGTKGTYKTGTLYYNVKNDGRFKVVEYDSPFGFTLEAQEQELRIERDNHEVTQDYRDEEVRATINFLKLDKEINYNNDLYPLGTAQGDAVIEGARYGLYARENILSPDTGAVLYNANDLVEEKSTDAEGKITWERLYLGNYYIKEIEPSTGYLIDTTEYEVNILQYYIDNFYNVNDRTTDTVVYKNPVAYSLYSNPEQRVISLEKVKKQAIKILKITSKIDLSDENLRVQGAKFNAYLVSDLDVTPECNYTEIMNKYYNSETHQYEMPEEARAMTFEVNPDGELVSEMVTNVDGEVTSQLLAYGRYVLIEVDGAPDTQVAGEVVTDLELARPFFVRITEDSATPQQDRIITDPHMTAFIEVNKVDAKTWKNVRKAGAEYLINKITTDNLEIDGNVLTREPVIQTVAYPSRTEIGTRENPYKTDSEGRFTTPVALNAGLYELIEIKAPEDYVLNGYEAYTIDGEIIDFAQDTLKFKIATTEVYEETEPVATDSVNGGNKNGNVLKVYQYNMPQLGTIIITKTGEFQETSQVDDKGRSIISYVQKPVEGATFSVFAEEDIYTNDNQVDENNVRTKYFTKDQKIMDITTNAEGKAFADNLPLGKYYVKEIVAGDGYVLNETVKHFEISKNTLKQDELVENEVQKTAINKEADSYINERQKVKITVLKTDKDLVDKKIADAEFSIYAAEDIKNKAGDTIVESNSLVGIAVTNSEGLATFTEDLPLGKYYIKETRRPYGYLINNDIILIDVQYVGQTLAVSEVNTQMKDERMDAKVIVHHYIENTTISLSDDELIEGKVFDAYNTEVANDIPEWFMVKEIPENADGYMTEEDIVVTYYYKLRPYTVIVNYLELDDDDDDSNNTVLHERKEIPNQTYETEIKSRDEIINIPGYKFDSVDKEILKVDTDESKNYITIYYKKDDIKFRVEYYYDGVKDSSETETYEAEFGSTITKYEDKIRDNYKFEKDENVPLKITSDEDKNVIKVYYVRDKSTITIKFKDKDGNEIQTEQTNKDYVGEEFDIDKVDDKIDGYKLIEKSDEGKTEYEEDDKTIVFVYEKVPEKEKEPEKEKPSKEKDEKPKDEPKEEKTEQRVVTIYANEEDEKKANNTYTAEETTSTKQSTTKTTPTTTTPTTTNTKITPKTDDSTPTTKTNTVSVTPAPKTGDDAFRVALEVLLAVVYINVILTIGLKVIDGKKSNKK